MEKKKLYLIGSISILIIILICVIGYFIYKSNSTVWITDYEYLYDKAIEYLNEKDTAESYDKNKEGFKIFFDYEPFGIEERGNKKIAYMWILEEEHYMENNEIESGEGGSMPYKFVFENNEVIKYQIPSDGSEYGPSIKRIFPKSIEREVMRFQIDSSKLREDIEEYYSNFKTNTEQINANSIKSYSSKDGHNGVIMDAVVVKVDEESMLVMKVENSNELIRVGFLEKGNIGYKQGQEIEIYYDGMILETYPERLGKIDEIEIIKDKSDVEIPDDILRYCYSSRDNVSVEIAELTNSGIYLKITDINELKYNYSHKYKITKKVKNPNYTGVGYKIGEDTETSTAGFTGTGAEYIWEEIDKISDILYEDTEDIKSNTSKELIDRKFDWTQLYGNLESGKYKFYLIDEDCLGITIEFAIDENGNISYNEPQILY